MLVSLGPLSLLLVYLLLYPLVHILLIYFSYYWFSSSLICISSKDLIISFKFSIVILLSEGNSSSICGYFSLSFRACLTASTASTALLDHPLVFYYIYVLDFVGCCSVIFASLSALIAFLPALIASVCNFSCSENNLLKVEDNILFFNNGILYFLKFFSILILYYCILT